MSRSENPGYISSTIGYFIQVTRDGFRSFASPSSFKKAEESGYLIKEDRNNRSNKNNTEPFDKTIKDIGPKTADDESAKMLLARTQKGIEIFKRIPPVPPMLFRPKGFGSALWVLGRYAGGKYTRYVGFDMDRKR